MKLVASILCLAQIVGGLQVTAAPTKSRAEQSTTKKANKRVIAFLGFCASGVAISLLLKHHNNKNNPTFKTAATQTGTTTSTGGVMPIKPPTYTQALYLKGWGYVPTGGLIPPSIICTNNNSTYCNGMDATAFIQALKVSDTTGEWSKLLGANVDYVISFPYYNPGQEILIKQGVTSQEASSIISNLNRGAPAGAVFSFNKQTITSSGTP